MRKKHYRFYLTHGHRHTYTTMKLLFAACLIVLVGVACSEQCRDHDPLTCTVACGPNQVHACYNDRCFCTSGEMCLSVTDCHLSCNKDDFHSHCIDGECHCLKIDEIDNSDN